MMKKFYAGLTAFVMLAGVAAVGVQNTTAATDNGVTNVNLDVTADITITCDASINMTAIAGTGQSTLGASNTVDCNVVSNNAAGYQVDWQSTAAVMSAGGADDIEAYVAAVPGTPENWATTNFTDGSGWGARLDSNSEVFEADEVTQWSSTDTYAGGLWMHVDNSTPYVIVDTTTVSGAGGDDLDIMFGAEIESSQVQPTGTYDQDVTFTATTL